MYGPLRQLGLFRGLFIVLQLTFAGLLVLLMDELLQKGYGLGSGISLFITTNTCETILWKSFSPTTVNAGRGTEIEGAIIAFFHLMMVRKDKTRALKEAFYRRNLPNLTNVMATVVVFLLVLYFQGFQVELPLRTQHATGHIGSHPIKLFYTSNMPIILQSAVITNFFMISQMLYRKLPTNLLVRLIGTWEEIRGSRQSIPVAGISYYISPPHSIFELFRDPIHMMTYLAVVLGGSTFFSKHWVSLSGSSAKDVAKQLKQQKVTLKGGYRDEAVYKKLDKNIRIAAALGGFCIGLLSVVADFLGNRSLLLHAHFSQPSLFPKRLT